MATPSPKSHKLSRKEMQLRSGKRGSRGSLHDAPELPVPVNNESDSSIELANLTPGPKAGGLGNLVRLTAYGGTEPTSIELKDEDHRQEGLRIFDREWEVLQMTKQRLADAQKASAVERQTTNATHQTLATTKAALDILQQQLDDQKHASQQKLVATEGDLDRTKQALVVARQDLEDQLASASKTNHALDVAEQRLKTEENNSEHLRRELAKTQHKLIIAQGDLDRTKRILNNTKQTLTKEELKPARTQQIPTIRGDGDMTKQEVEAIQRDFAAKENGWAVKFATLRNELADNKKALVAEKRYSDSMQRDLVTTENELTVALEDLQKANQELAAVRQDFKAEQESTNSLMRTQGELGEKKRELHFALLAEKKKSAGALQKLTTTRKELERTKEALDISQRALAKAGRSVDTRLATQEDNVATHESLEPTRKALADNNEELLTLQKVLDAKNQELDATQNELATPECKLADTPQNPITNSEPEPAEPGDGLHDGKEIIDGFDALNRAIDDHAHLMEPLFSREDLQRPLTTLEVALFRQQWPGHPVVEYLSNAAKRNYPVQVVLNHLLRYVIAVVLEEYIFGPFIPAFTRDKCDFLEDIHAAIRNQESQARAGRWRRIAYTRGKISRVDEKLVSEAANHCLAAAAVYIPLPIDRSAIESPEKLMADEHREAILSLCQKALELKDKMALNYPAVDYITLLPTSKDPRFLPPKSMAYSHDCQESEPWQVVLPVGFALIENWSVESTSSQYRFEERCVLKGPAVCFGTIA